MGQVLAGHYQIEQELGQGGFGKTFLARDHHLPGHPLCVVKQLQPQLDDPDALKVAKRLFTTEAQILQRLGEHPQIPRLLAFFEQQEEFYLVQEYIQGHELASEIREGQPWQEDRAIAFLRDILTPLDFVHQQGVIHRDLKPSNIIRRSLDNQLVLIDFGAVKQTLSQVHPLTGRTSQTPVSVIIGSPNYMPSEQAIGRPKFSSDIYAVGVMAIQALTGKSLPELPKDPETEEILWKQFASVRKEFEEVLGKMVCYHFGDRYSYGAEALEAINSLSSPLISTVPPIAESNHLRNSQPEETHPIFPAAIAPDNPTLITELNLSPVPVSNLPKRSTFNFEVVKNSDLTAPEFELSPAKTNPDDPTEISQHEEDLQKFSNHELPKCSTFNFEVVTVNHCGELLERQNYQAQSFQEDLGDGVCLEMVSIPGGTFLMGSPGDEDNQESDESPQHLVTVAPFYLGKFQVTQAQWHRVASFPQINLRLESKPSHFQGDDLPVEQISWDEVQELCLRLSSHTGRNYRLPSEAQWEYACRAGSTTPFHVGETLTIDLANYKLPNPSERELKTRAVGSFNPNRFGLYDMHGNVWEWCNDHWHNTYNLAPNNGESWLSGDQPELKVIRGGSWSNQLLNCRSAHRNMLWANYRGNTFGFRVALRAAEG
ncbi:bifunctional serine/threonine-protein kinase/formylglycine-generating enzyme family protein [Roseofilum reptotaenium CS-1145]|uniref:Protein kinase domain-containing protein n=1 Tax=Roseofilum reptotaenium AO1-A TaxID=1925591 RepID=A0A1L9QMQ3_9CYAN|nr:bifunctional serine/threonine-protein kinase/formylglycine-generating enzyme family protein [Roseofilum reptotaenium]MDB9517630.1 bifunctional serine/threonine-protein kinase/formylglycine-generating enzyme family protein [Roseofilum reptotaenium CS-1145]OJJ22695.1 hypothetical protein BI308_19255 [Roseofilum reptotaenium AO1-A]